MDRDWRDFKSINGNIAGAREAFENACETLFRLIHDGQHVSQVRVKSGDGGIDIFIGELGIEPITVIQCKFFLEDFGDSQKAQIRKSFKSAVESEKYDLKKWILCIPRIIDIDENSWWFKWKHKELEKIGKDKSFIQLRNGNYLIDEFKHYKIYNTIFKIDDSIKIDEIHKALISPKKIHLKPSNHTLILFNHYTEACDKYYHPRKIDSALINNLEINNVWVYGKSGKGKTTLINRNLIQEKIHFCFCDLSPIIIEKKEDVINEILYCIEDSLDIKRNNEEVNGIKCIVKLLNKAKKDKYIIVIDELSLKTDILYSEIANELNQLVIHYNNLRKSDTLRFIISTINNPIDSLENLNKASELFQFIDCNDWENELSNLFDILDSALGTNLEKFKSKIVESSNHSPRMLKNIFRKIILSHDLSEKSIAEIISKTIKEQIR